MVALDDSGTGFNSEKIPMESPPSRSVKAGILIVWDINRYGIRLVLMSSLIGYAKARNILLLAEGVDFSRASTWPRSR